MEVKASVPDQFERVTINPIMYFQKPVIGNAEGNDLPPIQLIFPNGGFGLGVCTKDQNDIGDQNSGSYPVVASGPEFSNLDESEKKGLKIAFLALALCNLVMTSMMFSRADTVDTSKVEYITGPNHTTFDMVSHNRRNIEVVNFAFIIVTLFVGSFSCILNIPLGLSAYAVSVVLNFILGTSSLPFFVYSMRYVLDVFMLYIALIHRSRLLYSFLPAQVRN